MDLIEFNEVLHRRGLYWLNQLCVRFDHQLGLLVGLSALERADGLPVHHPGGIIGPALILLEHLQGGVQLIVIFLLARRLLLEGVRGSRRFELLLLGVLLQALVWPLVPRVLQGAIRVDV